MSNGWPSAGSSSTGTSLPREAPRNYREQDAELAAAVDRFVAERPDVRAVVISMVRQPEGISFVLRVESADDVVAFTWDTRRSMLYAATRQADRLHALLAGHGLHVYKSRKSWLAALARIG